MNTLELEPSASEGPAGSRQVLGASAAWRVAIVFACAITLTVAGYQFGGSNHTVYLLDAMRHAHPELLQRDWFTTQTLQYHALFGLLTRGLMRAGILEPAFLVGYLVTVVVLQWAWAGIARVLGGSPATYLVSVVLYYLLAAGTGLGFFSLEQDGAFLPSNVANAALLCAVYLYVAGRLGWSWVWLGVAGLFHLNHAVTGAAIWAGLTLWQGRRARAEWVGIAVGGLLCLVNVAVASRVVLGRSGKLPLDEFIALYVRLRHPHHMDVWSWPVAVWACFLLPVVAGGIASVYAPPTGEWVRFRRVFVAFVGVIAVALATAGFWIAGETFVQMQWYRFSVYPKLLGCVACAYALGRAWARSPRMVIGVVAAGLVVVGVAAIGMTGEQARVLREVVGQHAFAVGMFVALSGVGLAVLSRVMRGRGGDGCGAGATRPASPADKTGVERWCADWRAAIGVAVVMVGVLGWGWPRLGLRPVAGDGADYLAVCDWARENTPTDAVFVVPPGEQSFRLRARRAIVVNFKGIPQLSAEMAEWRDRLSAVFGIEDLAGLRGTFEQKLIEMNRRYAKRPREAVEAVAARYGADFVVVERPWDGVEPLHQVGRYWVYPAR